MAREEAAPGTFAFIFVESKREVANVDTGRVWQHGFGRRHDEVRHHIILLF